MAQDMITEEYKIISTPFDPGNSTFLFSISIISKTIFAGTYKDFWYVSPIDKCKIENQIPL